MTIIKFILKVVAGFFIIIFLIGFLIAISAPTPAELSKGGAELMNEIENQVATDAEGQYYMVQQSGTMLNRCVQAGMVAAAWLQANNATEYDTWKQVEARDCANAGLPR